jgi:hypothetical protein
MHIYKYTYTDIHIEEKQALRAENADINRQISGAVIV